MSSQPRTRIVMEIADSAADFESEHDRTHFIDSACGGDEELKQQVREYLEGGAALFAQTRPRNSILPENLEILSALIPERLDGIRPGSMLGPYRVEHLIGEGGMGQVYKARDTRLDRYVAIKVSKEEFGARFAREARVIASLNHPNICSLYDIGSNYLVMEFVEGLPLSGPLPLTQALLYAIQICAALESAHKRGIVHRDLKPGNILVTKAGAKLLDFGLAKMERPSGGVPNVDDSLTADHQIMGTLRYMAPETLRAANSGATADARSDIFAFGSVFYETLTGKYLFDGPSTADVVAGIIDRPAPSLGTSTPLALERLFQRCLEKDPDLRWQTVSDLRAELEWVAGSLQSQQQQMASPVRRRLATWIPWALAAASTGALFTFALLSRNTSSGPITRTSIALQDKTFVTPVISSDGTRLLYGQVFGQLAVKPRLWLRNLAEMQSHPIPGSEGGSLGTFSPDGNWVAFFQGPPPWKLVKLPVSGGNPVVLWTSKANVVTPPYWASDDTILTGSELGMVRVAANGAEVETLTTIDHARNEIGHFEPFLLPGGRGVVFTIATGSSLDTARDSAQVGVFDLKKGTHKALHISGSTPSFTPTGHLVYRRGAALLAVPFDVSALKVTGGESSLLEGLSTGLLTGASPYSFSRTGLLVYRTGIELKESFSLAWADRKGNLQRLSEPPHSWENLSLSPDGLKAVGDIPDAGDGPVNQGIFSFDLERKQLYRTVGEVRPYQRDHHPIWSVDGRSITFGSLRDGMDGLYNIPADSSGQPELLLVTKTMSYPAAWTPDGRTLLFYQFEKWKPQLFMLPILSGNKPGVPRRVNPDSPSPELQAALSPDGKWLAYTSESSGKYEVYVTQFPSSGKSIRISSEGGWGPKWPSNRRELIYMESKVGRLMSVSIAPGIPFAASFPQPLFTLRSDRGPILFDVAGDGSRFLVTVSPPEGTPASMPPGFVLVTNWFGELSKRAAR